MEKTKLLLTGLAHKVASSPLVHKAAHSFWQAASAYLVVAVFVSHQPFASVGDAKVILVGALAAGLSALKSSLVSRS